MNGTAERIRASIDQLQNRFMNLFGETVENYRRGATTAEALLRSEEVLLQEKNISIASGGVGWKTILQPFFEAQMAELVDASDSKSGVPQDVQVRFLFWAQPRRRGRGFYFPPHLSAKPTLPGQPFSLVCRNP